MTPAGEVFPKRDRRIKSADDGCKVRTVFSTVMGRLDRPNPL
jgi:hypothetical protein